MTFYVALKERRLLRKHWYDDRPMDTRIAAPALMLLGLMTFSGSLVAQDAPPTLAQAGDFIQRQLDGTLSIVVTSKAPDLFAQITKYVSVRVSGCSMSVVTDDAFGDLDSEPSLRESYEFSFKIIDPGSFTVKEFSETGLLEFDTTEPITITSVEAKTKKVDLTKVNTAQFRLPDVKTAKRLQAAFFRVSELCGAKKDVF
jgi:hypothetical protein